MRRCIRSKGGWLGARRQGATRALWLAAMAALVAGADAAAQKNVLFILTDEQRFDTSAPYGNHAILTPHLNRLGAEGVVFHRAYVSQPVCSPARATLLTGLYPHTAGVTRNNLDLPDGVRTLPELMGERSHVAGYIGKWHLGREVEARRGFDVRVSIEDGYRRTGEEPYSDYHRWLVSLGYTPDRTENGTFSRSFAARLPYEHTKAVFVEREAIHFIERNRASPWVLVLGFLEPHEPNFGPFDALHDPSLVVLDSTHALGLADRPREPLRHAMLHGYGDDPDSRAAIARYWGLVHAVDRSVGAILRRLDDLGLRDSTVVVLTSEHGKLMGQYGHTGKTVMYEHSVRVPWIIRAPGVAPRRVERPVSHIDFVPTLLDLMGLARPGHLQGQSLVPEMRGAVVPARPVFIEWNPFAAPDPAIQDCPRGVTRSACERALGQHIRTIVTPDGWKLNWSDGDRSQLFHLPSDPLELHDLHGLPEHRARAVVLEAAILNWQRRTEDPVPLPPGGITETAEVR